MINRKLAILAVVALAAGPVFAQQPEAPQRRVGYGDLNLASPAGVATLHHRITAAIEDVCGTYDGVVLLEQQVEIDKCRSAARNEADQRVAALLASRTQVASVR